MKILSEKENKDGYVTFEMYFDQVEIQILVEYAIINILKEYIERETKNVKKSKVIKPVLKKPNQKGSKDAKKPKTKK